MFIFFFFFSPFTFRGEYFPQDNTDKTQMEKGGRMPGIAWKNKHDHERKHRTVQTEINIWYKKGMIPCTSGKSHKPL